MTKKNRQNHMKEDEKSQVKLYKTGHGWVSCLTRFFKFLSFKGKEDVQAQDVVDPDALSGDNKADTTSSWLR